MRGKLKDPIEAAAAFLSDLKAHTVPAPVRDSEELPGIPTNEIGEAAEALVEPYYAAVGELSMALVESSLELRALRRQLAEAEERFAEADKTNARLLLELARCRDGDDGEPRDDNRSARAELVAAREALRRILRLARPHVNEDEGRGRRR